VLARPHAQGRRRQPFRWRFFRGGDAPGLPACVPAVPACSASDVRLGIMGRYNIAPTWPLSPWVGLGLGYEWGSFSEHQVVFDNTETDSSWDGFEIAHVQHRARDCRSGRDG
jgi:hypothetical protein